MEKLWKTGDVRQKWWKLRSTKRNISGQMGWVGENALIDIYDLLRGISFS